MPRIVKYFLAATAVLACLVVALWEYSSYEDERNFAAAGGPAMNWPDMVSGRAAEARHDAP